MKRSALFLAGFVALTLFARAASATALILTVHDTINPFTESYIVRGLKEAQQRNSELVVILLDTPGGLMDSMRGIVQEIMATPTPVVVYIYPPGAHGGSAGAFILMSADVAAMAPGTTVGSAHPVGLGPTGPSEPAEPAMPGQPEQKPPEDVMGKKIAEDAAALIRSMAARHHRNGDVAQKFVFESISVTEQEALSQHVIDLLARDTPDLLAQLDGRVIEKNERKITLKTKNLLTLDLPMTPYESFFSNLANPNLIYLLFTIGLAALTYEFFHPGTYYPGVIGLLCLALALVAVQALPVNYGAMLLIAAGIIMFIVELKSPTHGFFGVAGVVSFVVGSFLMFGGSEARVSPWTIWTVAAILFGFLGLAVTVAVRAARRKSIIGIEDLKGKGGEVTVALNPEGQVFIEGENWRAETESGPLQVGERVVVIRLEGLKLFVRRKG